LATLLKAASSIPVFSDVNNIFSTTLPWFNCILASPPCQPWSIRGDAKGVHDPRAATLPRFHQALLRFKPRGGMMEMVDGMRTWVSRGLHSSIATGPAYEEFASRIIAAGFVITSQSRSRFDRRRNAGRCNPDCDCSCSLLVLM
jgi:site-specific DNA-cytosine methylase